MGRPRLPTPHSDEQRNYLKKVHCLLAALIQHRLPMFATHRVIYEISQEFAEANWDESAEDQEDLQQWQVIPAHKSHSSFVDE